jgi:hypothetical protein
LKIIAVIYLIIQMGSLLLCEEEDAESAAYLINFIAACAVAGGLFYY